MEPKDYKGYNFKKNMLLTVFSCFIMIISFLNINKPVKKFSGLENRYLKQKPKFSFSQFLSGEYTKRYEDYINDQFIFRDRWIDIKAIGELMLLKRENNNIILGKDGYLFDKIETIDKVKVNKNLKLINKFLKGREGKRKVFSIIPNSYEILKGKLPMGLNNINQREEINRIYGYLKASNLKNIKLVDGLNLLKNNSLQLFYRTDHHWTTTGAYLFYDGLSDYLDYTPIKLDKLNKGEIKGFLGSYYSKAKIPWVRSDKIDYYKIPIKSLRVDNRVYNSLYDFKQANECDKYSFFLYGNNGISIIDSKMSEGKAKSILIFNDSYARSLIPFLTYNYKEIYSVDLRYISENELKKVFSRYNIDKVDEIMIIYNFSNFIQDSNFNKLSALK